MDSITVRTTIRAHRDLSGRISHYELTFGSPTGTQYSLLANRASDVFDTMETMFGVGKAVAAEQLELF